MTRLVVGGRILMGRDTYLAPTPLFSCILRFLPWALNTYFIEVQGTAHMEVIVKLLHTNSLRNIKVTSRDSRAVAEQITKTLGCQADHTIECTGAQPSIATTIYVSAGLATI